MIRTMHPSQYRLARNMKTNIHYRLHPDKDLPDGYELPGYFDNGKKCDRFKAYDRDGNLVNKLWALKRL